MDNQIELKPCPFCGGEATFMRYSAGSIGAGCRKCAIMFFVLNGNELKAAEAWNRRSDNQLSVGDKVYQTNGFNTYESTVKHVLYDTEKITFDADAIGQSVFLTREEAEKRTMHLALEEAENHDEKS